MTHCDSFSQKSEYKRHTSLKSGYGQHVISLSILCRHRTRTPHAHASSPSHFPAPTPHSSGGVACLLLWHHRPFHTFTCFLGLIFRSACEISTVGVDIHGWRKIAFSLHVFFFSKIGGISLFGLTLLTFWSIY